VLYVPDVLGMTLAEAFVALDGCNLEAVNADAGPLVDLSAPDVIVVWQEPEPGAELPPTYTVRLRVERPRGPAGVREFRNPHPRQSAGSGMVDEETGEAIG
jgi:beta-lactam-binding protein with PASTA domain